MTIFLYELKQLKTSIIVWSLSLAVTIFCMMPVMILTIGGAQDSFSSLFATFSDNSFFTALGIDMAGLAYPIGAYSYVLSIMAIAFAVFGGNLGISALSKEWNSKTADFLMTKPHSRGRIYASKALAAVCACIITWIVFLIVSYISLAMFSISFSIFSNTGNDFTAFLLVAGTAGIICLFYMSLGLFIGVLFPFIHSPSIVSIGLAFVTFITGSFARVTESDLLIYFSPFAYFDSKMLRENCSYDAKVWVLIVVAILCVATGYFLFKRKDIIMSR